MDWFMSSKRALLAPFGVGTVDQTFISVLRARYSVLRIFGLHRKVVIFDEVHAYDTYMTEIFTCLLAWLRAIGSSAILLSATLPRQTRQMLAQAYQKCEVASTGDVVYPRLTSNDGKAITVRSLGAYADRTILLKKIPYDPQASVDSGDSEGWLYLLRDLLSDGGCAAVICNTVDRAQAIFSQIRSAAIVDDEDLFLLHARMPFCTRAEREGKIKRRFGKLQEEVAQPRRGIVVATQIIEQSLDLDFDLMITDLAPVDLLIQRIGRLQRHQGSQYPPKRAPKLKTMWCMVCQPQEAPGGELVSFGSDRFIYDEVFMQRTYFALKPLQSLNLPSDSDVLINKVYSPEPLDECNEQENHKISELYRRMVTQEESATLKAHNHMVGDVDYSNSFSHVSYLKDDYEVGETARAMTRNIVLPTVHLVCFIGKDGETLLFDGNTPYDPNTIPSRAILPKILRSTVAVSKREVVAHFRRQPVNKAWYKQPTIRNAFPVLFENNRYDMGGGNYLILDNDLGLLILKQEG